MITIVKMATVDQEMEHWDPFGHRPLCEGRDCGLRRSALPGRRLPGNILPTNACWCFPLRPLLLHLMSPQHFLNLKMFCLQVWSDLENQKAFPSCPYVKHPSSLSIRVKRTII